MLDQSEESGLVCAYRVDDRGAMSQLAWADIDFALADETSVVWLHFDHADARARDWITTCTHLPDAARTLLLGDDRHMRIEVCDHGLSGVVGDLHHDFTAGDDYLGLLRLYLDKNLLISVRRKPLVAIDKLRQALGEGLKVERPVTIVAQFLHHVTDTLSDLLLELAENLDELEEGLLAGEMTRQLPDLARIRRIAVRLRRHMVPQQHALFGLRARLPAWIDTGDAQTLHSAIERLGALGHDLDLVQERARLLADQLAARLAEATNRNLYILSVVTTIFLPMTLVTGIFGMNLGGLPGQNHPFGFWYGTGAMIALGALTLLWLRRRGMLARG